MMNEPVITPELIERLVDLSRRAGAAIMAIYNNQDSYHIEHKSDESPRRARPRRATSAWAEKKQESGGVSRAVKGVRL